MFEDSLVEPAEKIRTKKGITVVISAMFHIVLIAVLFKACRFRCSQRRCVLFFF